MVSGAEKAYGSNKMEIHTKDNFRKTTSTDKGSNITNRVNISLENLNKDPNWKDIYMTPTKIPSRYLLNDFSQLI